MPTEEELAFSAEIEAIETGKALEPLAESAALNKLLLRNARQSPNVIAQRTGIPAAEVAERLTTLLDNPSIRDDLMEEKLLLAEVSMLVDDIRDRMSRYNVEDEGWASMARVQLAAIRTMLEQLDKRRKAVNGQLVLVNRELAYIFVTAIKMQQEIAIRNISEKYPELDPEIIYTEFEDALPEAITYIDGKTEDG
jgi:hypothetical protein